MTRKRRPEERAEREVRCICDGCNEAFNGQRSSWCPRCFNERIAAGCYPDCEAIANYCERGRTARLELARRIEEVLAELPPRHSFREGFAAVEKVLGIKLSVNRWSVRRLAVLRKAAG